MEPLPASIISCSRRTDVPRYYAAWFAARRREGCATFRNAFGGAGQASLRPEDVVGYVFWTRDGRPLGDEISAICQAGIPVGFQFTLNGYGADLEPGCLGLDDAIASFHETRARLAGSEAIQWRYDPIVLSERYPATYHRDQFGRIASRIAGSTRVVNVSVVEPYLRAIRRMPDASTRYRQVNPDRHRAVASKYPGLPVASDAAALLLDLAAVAKSHGIDLRSCSNPELPIPPSQCIGRDLFAPYGDHVLAAVDRAGSGPSRQGCRCLRCIDIGMDETCPAGCRYCYVTQSIARARACYQAHDPSLRSLR